jgi:ribosomal protein S18 acetylase RimI-like enzyme
VTSPLIRLFRAEDDAVCRKIASRAAMSAYGPKMRTADKVADESAPLEDAELRLVAEIDGKVVGFAASNAGHLENLFVDPSAQGRNIGRDLLMAFEGHQTGDVTLNVLTLNPRGRAFYERHGYACSSMGAISYFGEELSIWRMTKRVIL